MTEKIPSQNIPEDGIRSKIEKDRLYTTVRTELEQLKGSFSQEEIHSFLDKLSTAQDIKNLKEELNKMAVTSEKRSAIEHIFQLVETIHKSSTEEIESLKLSLLKDDPISDENFAFHKNRYVAQLEKKRLGENVAYDAVGICVGLGESLIITLTFIFSLLQGLVAGILSPREFYRGYREYISQFKK